jgi:hypothetical protein
MKKRKRHLLEAFYLLTASSVLFACPIPVNSKVASGSHLLINDITITQNSLPFSNHADLLIEEFSFLIKDFKMNHQSEINNLNIMVRYRYAANISDGAYPDFRLITKDIENLLTNYPNKRDYWEIINKKITLMVLSKYPVITSVACELQVSPSPLDPYLRSSIVTRNRSGVIRADSKKSMRRK